MSKIKRIFLTLGLFTIITSCGVGQALAPQKKSGTDEFLVKKIPISNAAKLWRTTNSL